MKKNKHCCICGKEIKGYGNNPSGALGVNGQPLIWAEEDVCCDECNSKYVITGRLYAHARDKNA